MDGHNDHYTSGQQEDSYGVDHLQGSIACNNSLHTTSSTEGTETQLATSRTRRSYKRTILADITNERTNATSLASPKHPRQDASMKSNTRPPPVAEAPRPFWNETCAGMTNLLWMCTKPSLIESPVTTTSNSVDKLLRNSWFAAKKRGQQQPEPGSPMNQGTYHGRRWS